jgi:membrane protein
MVLLLWVYYSAQLVLFGAEFTRVLGAERGRSPTPKSFARKKRK